MKSLVFLVLTFCTPLVLIAGPPFNYNSAVTWAEESTKTDVPRAQRIYIFGPKKISETYSLNNKSGKRDISLRRILPYRESMTLGPLLRSLRDDVASEFLVLIYRRADPIMSVFRLTYAEALTSKFSLQPLDVIRITLPAHGFTL